MSILRAPEPSMSTSTTGHDTTARYYTNVLLLLLIYASCTEQQWHYKVNVLHSFTEDTASQLHKHKRLQTTTRKNNYLHYCASYLTQIILFGLIRSRDSVIWITGMLSDQHHIYSHKCLTPRSLRSFEVRQRLEKYRSRSRSNKK